MLKFNVMDEELF